MNHGVNYDYHVTNAWANKLSLIMFPAASYFPLMVISVLWSQYTDQFDEILSYSVYSAMFAVYTLFVILSVLFLYFPSVYLTCCCRRSHAFGITKYPWLRFFGLSTLLALVTMCYALMCFYHAMQSCDATIATTPMPVMALIHLRILLPGTKLATFIVVISIGLFACIPLMNPTCYILSTAWIKTYVPEFVWFMLCTAICFIDNLSFRGEDRDAFYTLKNVQEKFKSVQAESATCSRLIENIIPPEYKHKVIRECAGRITDEKNKKGIPMFCTHLEFMICMAIDGVHFTGFCTGKSASEIVRVMGGVFEIVDDLIQQSLYARKIKQVGDASHIYFHSIPTRSGVLPLSEPELCIEAIRFGALAMTKIQAKVTELAFRCGIACGPGSLIIIGEQRISFDCVGKSKTMAEKMESTGIENKIQCCNVIADLTRLDGISILCDGKHIIDPHYAMQKICTIDQGEEPTPTTEHRLSTTSTEAKHGRVPSKLKTLLAAFGINAGITPLEMLFGVDLSGGSGEIIKRAKELYQKKRLARGIMFIVIIVASLAIGGSLLLSEYPESASSRTNASNIVLVFVLAAVQVVLCSLYICFSHVFFAGYVLCNLSHLVLLGSIASAFFFGATSSIRFSSAFVFTLDAAIACHGVYFFPIEILVVMIGYNTVLIILELIVVPEVFGTSIIDALAANWMYYMTTPVACVLFVVGEYLTRYTSLSKHRDAEKVKKYDKRLQKKIDLAQNLLNSFLPKHVIAHYASNTLHECNVVYPDAVVLICVIKDFSSLSSNNIDKAINFLHQVFTAFDSIQGKLLHAGVVLEKVKSSGEQYIAFARRDENCNDQKCCAISICSLAKAMVVLARGIGVKVQIGIAMGEVCACVVGSKKYQYDIYSSAVNMAARLSTVICNDHLILCQKEIACLFPETRSYERADGHLSFTSVGPRYLKGLGQLEVFHLATSFSRNQLLQEN